MSLKEKHEAKINQLKKEGLSVLKIAGKLKINRGVVNSVIYGTYPKGGKKKAVKAGKKKKSKKT
jgi:uncharacterized protein YciI